MSSKFFMRPADLERMRTSAGARAVGKNIGTPANAFGCGCPRRRNVIGILLIRPLS